MLTVNTPHTQGFHDVNINKVQQNSGNAQTSSTPLKLFVLNVLKKEKKRIKNIMSEIEKEKQLILKQEFEAKFESTKKQESSANALETRLNKLERDLPDIISNTIQQQFAMLFSKNNNTSPQRQVQLGITLVNKETPTHSHSSSMKRHAEANDSDNPPKKSAKLPRVSQFSSLFQKKSDSDENNTNESEYSEGYN